MASNSWKLVVAPLSAPTETREVVVVAENWLSALRLARARLGEEGGVPPGASCVMAATGEVTVVDMTTRRRFVLARTSEPETNPKSPENAPFAVTTPQPRGATSAETQGPGQGRAGSAIFPAVAAAPAAGPAQAKPRASTMAYSPEESAAIRAQLVAATQPAPQPAPPSKQAQPSGAGVAPPGRIAAPLLNAPRAAPPAAAPKRSNTVAYSPEESANVRAQLVAAQQAAQPAATQGKVSNGGNEPGKTALTAADAAKGATVAQIPSPFSRGGALVALSSRNEEPSAASPLVYRERCFFSPSAVDAATLERALREELEALRAQIAPERRGVFISLAVFDHYYQGKPLRGPIATLQWKDWRGEPVFVFSATQEAPHAPAPNAAPQAPALLTPEAAPAAAPGHPPAPREVVVGAKAVGAPAPRSALDSWPGTTSHDTTGDQDRRLTIAFEAVQDLYFLGSAAEGFDFGVKLLSELVPCEAVTGCLYDINTDELRFLALTGPGAEARKARAIPASVGLIGAATRSHQESIIVPDVASDPRFDPSADGRVGLESRNMMILPLHQAENVLGAIQLINRQNRSGFSEADAAVCTYVTAQLAQFLQSKRLGAKRSR